MRFISGKLSYSVILFILYIAGCQSHETDQSATLPTSKPVATPNSISPFFWKEIPMPFPARVFGSRNNRIIALGKSGAVEVSDGDRITALPSFKVAINYRSADGGLTNRAVVAKRFITDDLCFPEVAKLFPHSMYVFSKCENTSQLWSISFESKSTVLKVTNFLYADSNSTGDTLWGPTRMSATPERPMFPSFLAVGPTLMTSTFGDSRLKVLWRGNWNDGGIASVDFIGRNGWMLLSGGKLLRSYDSGDTWIYFSDIPDVARNKVIHLAMRNEIIGYVVGLEGLILSTEDSGKTWIEETSGINTPLYKIIVNDSLAAATGPYGAFLMRENNEKSWKKVEMRPHGDVSDLLFQDNKLYILVDGKLYFTEL